jgi:hypothetical protein
MCYHSHFHTAAKLRTPSKSLNTTESRTSIGSTSNRPLWYSPPLSVVFLVLANLFDSVLFDLSVVHLVLAKLLLPCKSVYNGAIQTCNLNGLILFVLVASRKEFGQQSNRSRSASNGVIYLVHWWSNLHNKTSDILGYIHRLHTYLDTICLIQ